MLDRIRIIDYAYETFHAIDLANTTNIFSELLNFAFGLIGVHNLSEGRCLEAGEVVDFYQDYPMWQQTAFKITDYLGNFSLVLTGIGSTPVIAVWKWGVKSLLTPEQLERFFGAHGSVPGDQVYRWITFLSFAMSLPSTLKGLYGFFKWAISPPEIEVTEEPIDLTKGSEKIGKETEKRRRISKHPAKEGDVFVTVKMVSEAAHRIMRTTRI